MSWVLGVQGDTDVSKIVGMMQGMRAVFSYSGLIDCICLRGVAAVYTNG